MKLNYFFLTLFLAIISFYMQAQEPILISGNLIDGTTKENIVFVNIGIEGTLVGTASNGFGEFNFDVPSELIVKNLYFSAIGYQNLLISVQEYLDKGMTTVELQPLSYGIDDIEISTESRVLYRILRDASRAVPSQFINQPFNFKAVYSSEEFINQVGGKKRDALILISDATGYGINENSFEARNYKFLNVQRNFDVKGLKDGTTLMDELLSLDIARSPGNILDTAFLKEYDLELAEIETLNGDSVWAIEYQLSNPDLSRTGDLNATSMKGVIYISKKNKAILKNETHIKSKNHSPQGRSIAVDSIKSPRNVDYNFTTSYKSTNEGYVLDRIILNKNFSNSNKEQIKSITTLILIKEDTSQPQMLSNRQYFEKLISDPDFWFSSDLKK